MDRRKFFSASVLGATGVVAAGQVTATPLSSVQAFDSTLYMKAANLLSGDTVLTHGYYSPGDGGGAYYIIEPQSIAKDRGLAIVLDNGLQARILSDGAVNVRQFGAKPGDPMHDNAPAIQGALNSKQKVVIPAGVYRCDKTLYPYKGQTLEGLYNPQHSIMWESNAVVLEFASGIHGIDTSEHIAIGFCMKGITLRGAASNSEHWTDWRVGLKLGIKGVTGGKSQSIKCHFEDCLISGFDINFGIYGFAWEVCLDRCFSNYARIAGFELSDSATLVNMINPTCLNTGTATTNHLGQAQHQNNSAVGISINTGDIQVNMDSPRFENTRNAAISIAGKAKVTINSLYCEGNRIRDILLTQNFSGTLTVNGGRMLHNNDGVTNDAFISDLSTVRRVVSLNNIEYVVGTTFPSNTINYGLYLRRSPTGSVELNNISLTGSINHLSSGNRNIAYLAQTGYFAPDRFSFDELPGVMFKRSNNSHVAEACLDKLPDELLLSDGDGAYDMLTPNSIAFILGELYRYQADSTWKKISL